MSSKWIPQSLIWRPLIVIVNLANFFDFVYETCILQCALIMFTLLHNVSRLCSCQISLYLFYSYAVWRVAGRKWITAKRSIWEKNVVRVSKIWTLCMLLFSSLNFVFSFNRVRYLYVTTMSWVNSLHRAYCTTCVDDSVHIRSRWSVRSVVRLCPPDKLCRTLRVCHRHHRSWYLPAHRRCFLSLARTTQCASDTLLSSCLRRKCQNK